MSTLTHSLAFTGLMFYLQALGAATIDVPADTMQTYLAPCYDAGKGVNCEVSGVALTGASLILANDKQMPEPGDPAIFTVALNEHRIVGTPTYLEGEVLRSADKFEGLTRTLDGKYVIAITAFNKAGTAQNPSADALNTLLYWPEGEPEKARIISASTRGQVTSSRELRAKISDAVGSPYYQIEAVSTAPGDRLLVGIRKHGSDSKSAGFSFLLLSISLSISEQGAELGDQFETLLSLTPDQLVEALGMEAGAYPALGLSGLEFDRYNNDRLYAVTSYERGDRLGGFLWVLPFEGDKPGKPRAIRLKDGSTLAFIHKPEGVEVLDESHVLIVHDDDRLQVKDPKTNSQRQTHEFAYSVVTFGAK
ncbi:hypothetical protein ACIPW4_22705 [Pseudomonas sp. NPDC089996]|uniref:hypothetical protein n=1 Tax=Pseudomonas sp. NPDC089996 TaxID=3364474 RepID=UPI00380F9519